MKNACIKLYLYGDRKNTLSTTPCIGDKLPPILIGGSGNMFWTPVMKR